MSEKNIYVYTVDSSLVKQIRTVRRKNFLLTVAVIGGAVVSRNLFMGIRKLMKENIELREEVSLLRKDKE